MSSDYPINEVAAEARERHERFGCDIHQKWTCAHCGARQTMEVANKFYLSGICEECKRITQIDRCNYMVVFGRVPETSKAN